MNWYKGTILFYSFSLPLPQVLLVSGVRPLPVVRRLVEMMVMIWKNLPQTATVR